MATDQRAEQVADGGVIAERLAEAQRDVMRLRAELAEALDARNALVFEAVDLWHWPVRQVARQVELTPQGVVQILAAGPPAWREDSAHPEDLID